MSGRGDDRPAPHRRLAQVFEFEVGCGEFADHVEFVANPDCLGDVGETGVGEDHSDLPEGVEFSVRVPPAPEITLEVDVVVAGVAAFEAVIGDLLESEDLAFGVPFVGVPAEFGFGGSVDGCGLATGELDVVGS